MLNLKQIATLSVVAISGFSAIFTGLYLTNQVAPQSSQASFTITPNPDWVDPTIPKYYTPGGSIPRNTPSWYVEEMNKQAEADKKLTQQERDIRDRQTKGAADSEKLKYDPPNDMGSHITPQDISRLDDCTPGESSTGPDVYKTIECRKIDGRKVKNMSDCPLNWDLGTNGVCTAANSKEMYYINYGQIIPRGYIETATPENQLRWKKNCFPGQIYINGDVCPNTENDIYVRNYELGKQVIVLGQSINYERPGPVGGTIEITTTPNVGGCQIPRLEMACSFVPSKAGVDIKYQLRVNGAGYDYTNSWAEGVFTVLAPGQTLAAALDKENANGKSTPSPQAPSPQLNSIYPSIGGMPSIDARCGASDGNLTNTRTRITCNFDLPSPYNLPPSLKLGVGNAIPGGSCTQSGTTVTCTNVPVGSKAGARPIYGIVSNMDKKALTVSKKIMVTMGTESGGNSVGNSSPLTNADTPKLAIICKNIGDDNSSSFTVRTRVSCGFKLPANKTLPQSFNLGVGNAKPDGNCTVAREDSVVCPNVPIGSKAGARPIYVMIGSDKKVYASGSQKLIVKEMVMDDEE